jgi:ribulose-phosphate 3-epimerase
VIQIIPAILTNNPQELKEKIALVEGLVKRVQIDIIDGVFANNKTIDLGAVGNLETSLLLDVQLMVKEPVDWIEKSVRAMSDRIIGHVEMMENQEEFVRRVQEVVHPVGLAIDLDTPVSTIDPLLLNNLDVVLVMSVKAGFGGQPFQPEVLEKVKQLDEIRARDATPFRICIDGGINEDDIKMAADAGVDEFVVGHALYDGDVQENLNKLMEAIN